MDYTNHAPLRAFARDRKLSPQSLYDLADAGKIQTVLINKRRHVLIDSYEQFIKRLVTEQGGAKLPDPVRDRPPPRPREKLRRRPRR